MMARRTVRARRGLIIIVVELSSLEKAKAVSCWSCLETRFVVIWKSSELKRDECLAMNLVLQKHQQNGHNAREREVRQEAL